jgi:hypothetical protein
MAIITKRYFYKGPWPNFLKMSIDIALTLPAPGFVIAYDITYDDAAASLAATDAAMRQYGCFPDTQNTIALSPTPFTGLKSPDGSVWKLSVDDLGILTTTKVSA